MSRNGKIGAGVVVLLVLAVVAVVAVGSAVGWYEEERPKSLDPTPGQKERVSSKHKTAAPPPAGRSNADNSAPATLPPRNSFYLDIGKLASTDLRLRFGLRRMEF